MAKFDTWFKAWVNRRVRVRTAIMLKMIGWGCVLFAAVAVLYSGLSAPITAPYGNTYRTDILVAAMVTLVHLAYLYIVFSQNLLEKAVENVRVTDLLFPFLLIVVYVLYGVHSIAFNMGKPILAHQLELSAYGAFIVLYIAWFLKDYRSSEWRDKHVTAVWCFADLVAIVMLFAYAFGAWRDGVRLLNYTVTPKDMATAMCIVIWLAFRWFAEMLSRTHYRAQYREYLRFNEAAVIEKNELARVRLEKSAVSVVDFGCGDGTRLVQLITWMRADGALRPDATVEVVGFDRDHTWADDFIKTATDAGINARFIGADRDSFVENLALADIVLLSHVLYELSTVRFLGEALAKVEKHAVVVARGTAASSYFTVVNLAYSRRFPRPTISHLWQSHGLQSLIDKGLLTKVHQFRVKQPFALNNGGKEAAGNLLGYLYGENAAQLAQEYFLSLVREGGNTISNDDMVVLLRRA
jgi:SAM-dependent methyltransferase